MSKEQIEKMSAEIREAVNGCSSYWSGLIAEHLHEQGYRRQSEVIDEIVSRLKEKLYTIPTVYNAHFSRMLDDVATSMKSGE